VCEETIAVWAAKFSSITESYDLKDIESGGEIG
jgi:hypothetical protein